MTCSHWLVTQSVHGGPLGESEEVKTIHNEKASTFHETLEVGVKDADKNG